MISVTYTLLDDGDVFAVDAFEVEQVCTRTQVDNLQRKLETRLKDLQAVAKKRGGDRCDLVVRIMEPNGQVSDTFVLYEVLNKSTIPLGCLLASLTNMVEARPTLVMPKHRE